MRGEDEILQEGGATTDWKTVKRVENEIILYDIRSFAVPSTLILILYNRTW